MVLAEDPALLVVRPTTDEAARGSGQVTSADGDFSS